MTSIIILWYPKFIFGDLKIELWISKNRIMDILNSAWFLDIQKWIFGYPKIHWFLDIQKWIMDILNSAWFLDIQKCILGYPKIHWFLDIQKWLMDIQKSNYGYPKFSMIFGYPKMYFRISKNWFMDILKYISGYPKLFCDILNSFLDIQKQNSCRYSGVMYELRVCKFASPRVCQLQISKITSF